MRLCTEIYKSSAESYLDRTRENQCRGKGADIDADREDGEDSQSLSH